MTNDLDKRWKDWWRARCGLVEEDRTKARFELLESLASLPADQRARLLPFAANYAAALNDIDETQFRKMLYWWMHPGELAFRQETVASLNCDPDAWKRGTAS